MTEAPAGQGFGDKTWPDQEEDFEGDGDHVEEGSHGVSEDDQAADKGLEESKDSDGGFPVGLIEVVVTVS